MTTAAAKSAIIEADIRTRTLPANSTSITARRPPRCGDDPDSRPAAAPDLTH